MAAQQKVEARPKKWLMPVGLVVLREEDSYGYELMERLQQFGFVEINPGALYRTLRRMENEGLCKSEWEHSEGEPARRIYSITEAGEAFLESWLEACEKYQEVMDTLSQAYTTTRKAA